VSGLVEVAAAPLVEVDPVDARAALGTRRIGPHVPIGAGLARAAERAHAVGASVIQVFTDDPRAWTPRAEPRPDLATFRELLAERDVPLLVHASYLVNLATPDELVFERSVERVRQELGAAAAMGGRAVNVHVGSHRGAGVRAGVERTAQAIERIVRDLGPEGAVPRLVLEDSAGQGDSLGVTIEELGRILDAAERRGVPRQRLGVCLDTAHLWGAGYDLDDPASVDAMLASLDQVVGVDGLAMIHLNDSLAPKGSRADRHQHIGEGRIGERGLGHLVRHPRLSTVPMILETPGMEHGWDAVNMARVRALLAEEGRETPPWAPT
jgi:deoxyribonuclease-4